MKAVRIEQVGTLRIINMDLHQPGRGEILIRVMASGICGTDVHIFRGEYMGSYPVIPGHEFAGEVVEIGEGVARFKPVNHVAVEPNISCGNCTNCLNNRQIFF